MGTTSKSKLKADENFLIFILFEKKVFFLQNENRRLWKNKEVEEDAQTSII